MTKVTIELPASVLIRNVDGKPFSVDTSKLTPEVIAAIAVGGMKITLTNAFNSGGKDRTDTERMAQMEKRVGAWYRGEYVIAERGESAYTGMFNAWCDEYRGNNPGTTQSDCEKLRAAYVKSVFGDESKVSTALLFQAFATLIAKESGTTMADELEALEAHYAKLADEAAQKRSKVAAKLDVSAIKLTSFRK